MNADVLPKTEAGWDELIKLAARFDDEAMVSCTPCYDGAPVLPAKEVPYAPRMMWVWDIYHKATINSATVVAKTTHHFALEALRVRSGDRFELVLTEEEFDHGH